MFRTFILNSALASIALAAFAIADQKQVPHQRAPAPTPAPQAFCFGDGSSSICPCGNTGLPGRGCENSAWSGGAILWMSGDSRLLADDVQFNVMGELPTSLSIVLQGNTMIRPAPFGDGLRCVGGDLKRLYAISAVGGSLTVPQRGDPSVSARAWELGDVLYPGMNRFYQVYYRDPSPRFCPSGGTFNVTNALALHWVK